MSRIIKPEGEELIRYLNAGYAICNVCGAVMCLSADEENYICPSCNGTANRAEYEYDYGDEELEWSPNMLDMFRDDIPCGYCLICGGPYPNCKTSCKLFDD